MNFSRIVERWAGHRPQHVAVHFQGEDISYAALWRRVEAATLRLASLGIHRGDRVAYLGYNHPELLAMLFACARLGAMLVPLNFRLAAPEHAEILAHADPAVFVVERRLPGARRRAREVPPAAAARRAEGRARRLVRVGGAGAGRVRTEASRRRRLTRC